MKPYSQTIFQEIYPRIQTLYKYYHLKKHHKISMQVFQEVMNLTCQEIMRSCTFYEEVENKGSQWELLLKEYKNRKEIKE